MSRWSLLDAQSRSWIGFRKTQGALTVEDGLEASGEAVAPVTPDQTATQLPTFARVRYSDKVASVFLWEMGNDPTDGVFVRINKNHSFYQTVLSTLEENSAERQAIEGMIWCAAVGEYLATTGLMNVAPDVIEQVLTKFKRAFGVNLDSWTLRNQDLFEHGRI